MMMHIKWTISAAVIFLFRVMFWQSINDLSWVKVIDAIVVSFVYLVFIVSVALTSNWHTMTRTQQYVIDMAFLAGSMTVIIRLLEYSPWAATIVSIGIAGTMALSTTLYLTFKRDWGVTAVLGLCTLFQTLKHEDGWFVCNSICGFGWVLLKGLFGVLWKDLKSAYDFLDNKELKDLRKEWEQDEIFREANPLHPKFRDYNEKADAFIRSHFGLPPRRWRPARSLTRCKSF